MWRNGKRFPCPDCHKTFATQVDLKAHLMRHITQHPYVCFACGKGFKYDHTLDFHIKSQHGVENGTASGSAGGNGNANTGSSKNESFNLKSSNRKSSKVKREVFDVKAGPFGSSGVSDVRRIAQQLQGRMSPPDPIVTVVSGNNSHTTAPTSGMANSCDVRLVNGEISNDLNVAANPLHLTGLNLSSAPGGLGLIEPNILNGLKFPIALSSYPSTSSSNSSQSSSSKSNNTLPIVPPPIPPSSTVSSSPLISTSLTSSLFTASTPLVSSLTFSSSSPTSVNSKEKLTDSSLTPLFDLGLQGDVLSPRNLQIKSEKVLISILEGVHPMNEQLYSLYKCCLCGFAFPSLEPVSIHIQSMHSNNFSLACDKCGAAFKWKSELQLHQQLHKVMDQSTNNVNTSSKKCKSQLPHHPHNNQYLQRDHLQHQQLQLQQPQSLVMPSFLQPNLVFVNPYLAGDQQFAPKESEKAKRAKIRGTGSEEKINGTKDDDQGLNLCLKRNPTQEICDSNHNSNINYDNNNNDNTIKHDGINYDNENNINNCNAHDSNNNEHGNHNNGHDEISSMMDEPIDLKVESPFADSNNNITPMNPLSFLHSSLLPSSVGLPFPPSQLTSAAAAAYAAGISSQPQHEKNKPLHQHFQSVASMVSGISTLTTTTSGASSTMSSGLGPRSVSGSASSSSSSGSVNGNRNSSLVSVGERTGKVREPIGDIEETAPGQFKCRYCEKTFDRIFSVHRHERVHTGYKPCICRVCGRGFSEKRNLRHHIIRFHSDGSGRELLKRVRKEKSMSAASFLKKAAVRLLSNSSLEGSAMEEGNNHSLYVSSDQQELNRVRDDKSANMRTRNQESANDDTDFNLKETESEVNGKSNAEDGDRNCPTFSSSPSSSSSRRRKSKPSKKITNLEAGDKSEEESEVSVESRCVDKDEREGGKYDDGDEDAVGERDESGKERDEEEEDEEEDENREGEMVTEYCENANEHNDVKNDPKERREKDCGDETYSKSGKPDLNGSANQSKCSHEGKSRLHGAFFSNYSPRLALVDKVLKRSRQSKPTIGPDGRYLYPCDHCQKTFCSSSDLNRHIGFHESKDIRPFKCEFCDYQSRTNSQLKVHVMRHAGIKQYLCHTCNYNGVTQSDLNRHRKTQSHKSRSGNVCAICSLGFSTQTLLEDHIFKFHDNNNTNNEDEQGPETSPPELKHGPLSPTSSSSPPTVTLPSLATDGSTASTSTFSRSLTTISPPSVSPKPTDKANEIDSNNNIDIDQNSVPGLNANRFSVNNLL